MSEPAFVLWTTDEQVLSTELSRIGHLSGKAVMDSLLALVGGIANATNPANVVRRGLNATVSGMNITLDTGELMHFVAGVSNTVSQYKLGAQTASFVQAVNAADVTNPRIDLISVVESTNPSDSSNRNILTLPSRQISSQLINTTQYPNLSFTYTAGIAAASPAMPATPAGQVALWAIYVPANAVSLLDNNLIDLRVRFHPNALIGAHFIEKGVSPSSSPASLTSLLIPTGRLWVNGALVDVITGSQTWTHAQLATNGIPASPNTEYHVYAIAKGSGDPVAKNVQDGVVFVVTTIAPGVDGRPSSPVLYRPFFNGPGGSNAFTVFSSNALYIGTIHTDINNNYEAGGSGVPFSRDGTAMIQNVDVANNSWCGASPGWVRQPALNWVDANTVSIGECAPVIAGQIGVFAQTSPVNASFSSNMFPGDTRTGTRFYYLYLRRNVSETAGPNWTRGAIRSYALQISAEAPNATLGKPTPQAGFQSFDYLYCGCFLDVSASAVRQFTRQGNMVVWIGQNDSFSSGSLSVEPTRVQITAPNMPATSKIALVEIDMRALATGAAGNGLLTTFNIFGSTGSTNPIVTPTVVMTLVDGVSTFAESSVSLPIPLNASRQFEMSINTQTAYSTRTIPGTLPPPLAFGTFFGFIEEMERLG